MVYGQENLAFETGAVDFIDKARGVEVWSGVCGVNISRAYWNGATWASAGRKRSIVHLLSNAGTGDLSGDYDQVHYEASSEGAAKAGIG
jgi:hypothetical protein